MGKLSSNTSKPRERISTQTKTSTRTGRLIEQRRRTTVEVRKKLKRKAVNKYRGFWLW